MYSTSIKEHLSAAGTHNLDKILHYTNSVQSSICFVARNQRTALINTVNPF